MSNKTTKKIKFFLFSSVIFCFTFFLLISNRKIITEYVYPADTTQTLQKNYYDVNNNLSYLSHNMINRMDIFLTFILGTLLFFFIYFIIIFFIKKRIFKYLFFSLTIFFIIVRTLILYNSFSNFFFPEIILKFSDRLEFIALIASTFFFILYISSYIKERLIFYIIISTLFFIFFLFSIVLNNKFYFTYLKMIFLFFLTIFFFLSIIFFHINNKRKKYPTEKLLEIIGSILFILNTSIDTGVNFFSCKTPFILPTFFIIYSAIYMGITIYHNSKSYNQILQLSNELNNTNTSLKKFVPFEFLHFLGKKDITSFKLGDNMETKVTIMFTDMRGFTKISNNMESHVIFSFLNEYLAEIAPVVTEYEGFVDKFIGDGIMSIFPKNPENALNAAIEMQTKIRNYNSILKIKQLPEIKIGCGIDNGNSVLGTIGYKNRMETTVISRSVNIAARLEALTKYLNTSILITENVFKKIDQEKYDFRYIGKLDNKIKDVKIYEVLNGCEPTEYSIKLKTKKMFEKAITYYEEGNLSKCKVTLKNVLMINPDDGIVKYYLKNII